MPSPTPSRPRPPAPAAAAEDVKRITVIPPGGADAVRAEMPTLVDEAELEAARLASMRRSSIPATPGAAGKAAAPDEGEIDVEWVVEPTPSDADDLSKGVGTLADLTRVPFVTVPFERLTSLPMDNRMAFLVALIDGASSIQNILDVAGMPQGEVLRALAKLLDLGVLGFRED